MKLLFKLSAFIGVVVLVFGLAACDSSITVIFDSGEGTSVEDVVVQTGELLEEPDVPTYEGYNFMGWYTDSFMQDEFDFDTEIKESITLKAKWEVKVMTITYDMNGGVQLDPVTTDYFSRTEVFLSLPSRTGYLFQGWFNEDLTVEYNASNLPEEDVTFYATWEQIVNVIWYHSNGGTEVTDLNVPYGDVPSRPDTPTNGDLEFLGWYSDVELNTVYNFNMPLNGNLSLYAKWNYQTLTITFVPSRPADEILTMTAGLEALMIAELELFGYYYEEITINVLSSYEGVVTSVLAGYSDVAYLPSSIYALYMDEPNIDVMLSADRYGLTKDFDNAIDWNDDLETYYSSEIMTSYYRGLIVAGPSVKGRELAEKINSGTALTWEDISTATWCVRSTTSTSGYKYPLFWLVDNYDGKTFDDMPTGNVIESAGYGNTLENLASGICDIGTIYADARMHYADDWTVSYGRTLSIWEEVDVIGVTNKIMNDVIVVSTVTVSADLRAAIEQAYLNIAQTDEGQEIMSVYGHVAYSLASKEDYIKTKLVEEYFNN